MGGAQATTQGGNRSAAVIFVQHGDKKLRLGLFGWIILDCLLTLVG
jgi:hypothetical protein